MRKRARKPKNWFWRWVFPLLLCLGALLAVIDSAAAVGGDVLRAANPVSVTGKVVETYRTRGGDTSDHYWVVFEYETEGKRYENTSSVAWEEMEQLAPGDEIPVFYPAGLPENSRALYPADWAGTLPIRLPILAAALLCLAGGIFLLWQSLHTLFSPPGKDKTPSDVTPGIEQGDK